MEVDSSAAICALAQVIPDYMEYRVLGSYGPQSEADGPELGWVALRVCAKALALISEWASSDQEESPISEDQRTEIQFCAPIDLPQHPGYRVVGATQMLIHTSNPDQGHPHDVSSALFVAVGILTGGLAADPDDLEWIDQRLRQAVWKSPVPSPEEIARDPAGLQIAWDYLTRDKAWDGSISIQQLLEAEDFYGRVVSYRERVPPYPHGLCWYILRLAAVRRVSFDQILQMVQANG